MYESMLKLVWEEYITFGLMFVNCIAIKQILISVDDIINFSEILNLFKNIHFMLINNKYT